MKKTLKATLPDSAWQAARQTWIGMQNAAAWPLATLHPWRRASIRQLAALKDKHRGQRCFIIGNGPSLKKTDLSKLKGEFTFGANRIYLMFPEMGFSTTYLVSVNSLVIEQTAEELRALPMPKFFSWRSRHLIRPTEDTIFLNTTYNGAKFSTDVRGRVWEGGTVTNINLQLAFHMGFEKVILIGVDHSYVTQGKPNTTVVSEGLDPNHVHPAYFGKGFRWQLPDLQTSEKGYLLALQAYQAAGRQVLDATVDGKLDIFPKVDYDNLF
jgi:hypothetical protein